MENDFYVRFNRTYSHADDDSHIKVNDSFVFSSDLLAFCLVPPTELIMWKKKEVWKRLESLSTAKIGRILTLFDGIELHNVATI